MPADRRSGFPRTRASGPQTTVNHIGGGQGGPGGGGHGTGTGGAGGCGMGPSLSFDISAGQFTMNNNVYVDDAFEVENPHRQDAVSRDARHEPRPGAYIHQNIHHHGNRGIDILHRAAALGAMYDSAESFPQPRCHPETRTEMLEDLHTWALDRDAQHKILWLHGPAGAGKSAIMQALSRQLGDAGRLGASFFFKRGDPARGNGNALFATIAYQLAINVPWLRAKIFPIVENDPSVLQRTIRTQMIKLISEPCRSQRGEGHVTIIVDGLDECERYDVQQEILHAIRIASSHSPIFLRFIVASRPELYIREVFESPVYSDVHHSFNVEQSFDDVRKYLSDEFARIHREHDTMAKIPSPWPMPDVLEELVEKSSGHFIYASTIIKFIDDKNYRPTQRLAVVQDASSTGSESAFDPLDKLCMTILSSASRQSELIPILCAIANFRVHPKRIDQLFQLPEGETRLLLRGLHSLIDVPSNDDKISVIHDAISPHHASFFDFLNNPGRSRTFSVGTLRHRIDLARMVLEAYVGPHENRDGFFSQFLRLNLMHFINSLPPFAEVAELLPLIGTMDPGCIFAVNGTDIPGQMLAWLEVSPKPLLACL
ncbi:hypothetical protein C8R45DRAFT_1219774 [Mycena sanguinolenta]|nr:hypothetical protein C8R45DRAFT_1219774 [Mycena sanguinolenta]